QTHFHETRSCTASNRCLLTPAAVCESPVQHSASSATTSLAVELEISAVEHCFTRSNLLWSGGAPGMGSCNCGLVYRVDLLCSQRRILRCGGANFKRWRASVAHRCLPNRSDARYLSGTGVFTALVQRYAPPARCRHRFVARRGHFRIVQLVRDAPRNSLSRPRRWRLWRRSSPFASTSIWFLSSFAAQDRQETTISFVQASKRDHVYRSSQWEVARPMKTMHFTNSWHENSGGVATFYRALIKEANRRQQQIRLVVPAAHDRIEETGDFGRIYHVQAPPAPFNSDYRAIYPSQFLFRGSKLQEILIAERPDLVEISDKYTLNYLGILLRLRLMPAVDFRPIVVGNSQERMDDNVGAYLEALPFARRFCSIYMKWLYFPFFDHHIANS